MNATPKQYARVATALGFSPMAKANLAEVHHVRRGLVRKCLSFMLGSGLKRARRPTTAFCQT